MRLPAPLKSASHPLLRQARALGRGLRERRDEGLFLVEGVRGLAEALDAGVAPAFVLVAAGRVEQEAMRDALARCAAAAVPVQPVQDALFARIAPSDTPSGLLAACPLPAAADRPEAVAGRAVSGPLVVAWEIQHPGNVGTLVRSGAAFGAAGLIGAGGADPWNPKAVRASAGAIHRLPVARAERPDEVIELLDAHGYRLIAAEPRGGIDPRAADWSGRVALLLGAEVAGLPEALVATAERVTIPMECAVESLSVPVAGSILLELARSSRGRPA